MKKTLKIAALATLVATPALADSPYIAGKISNVENPLYLPSSGEVYAKVGLGVMYKITDNNEAQKKLFHGGSREFPIWRPTLDLGLGITDRWAIHGQVGYTHNHIIERYGFHLGRLGTTYRIINNNYGWVWDVYGDVHLGGIQSMKGSLITKTGSLTDLTFNYDNYSNGRWGFHVGTKVGRTWNRWTMSGFVELLRTFGNHNNEIDVSALPLGLNKISVNLKPTTEYDFGLNAFYQADSRWSFGLGLKYIYHAENGVDGVYTEIPAPLQPTVNGLIGQYKNMHDRFNEFAQTLTVAYQATDNIQIAWYAENTFDDGQHLNANTTDLKLETGLRLNVRF